MFLTTYSSPDKADHFWLSFARIGISCLLLLSLLFSPLTSPVRSSTIIVNTLFLCWGIVAVLWHKFWKRSSQGNRMAAFLDLGFSIIIMLSYHSLSLSFVPAVFLLPILELSLLYGMIGAVFVIIAFACTIILSGLISTDLIQQPLWWITTLLWGFFIIFVATLQRLHLSYMKSIPSLVHRQPGRLSRREEQEKPLSLQAEDVWKIVKEYYPRRFPQVVEAFELPFQHMGVHIEDYHQEIEEAINTLYRFDADQQTISFCLHRLLQAAKQNWTGLAVFSPREREILELLLQSISYKEMSLRLHVSTSTIKTHVYHIFQKLEVSNREEAVSFIRERGWFSLNEGNKRDGLPKNYDQRQSKA